VSDLPRPEVTVDLVDLAALRLAAFRKLLTFAKENGIS